MTTKRLPTSTVGRGRTVTRTEPLSQRRWGDEFLEVYCGDALEFYTQWQTPTAIVSDGGYGVLGFEGDTSDHLDLPAWYEPHIRAWASKATALTTLWFWNSEIGWAAVHPVLERYGWRYVNANIWDKGKGHIAGNINTALIRRFPVVTEVCVQYVLEAQIRGLPLRQWLLMEWKRSRLPLRLANEACGVADAAVRKYFDQGHLWYYPPPEKFAALAQYANQHGDPAGRPYFSADGRVPLSVSEWTRMRSKFTCPHGVTNVWHRNSLRGDERITAPSGKALHLNQKPLDLMRRIVQASTEEGDVVWEPFGGLFSASIAARQLKRKAYGAELDETYFHYAVQRLIQSARQHELL